MKKIVLIFLAAICATSFCTHISASNENPSIISIDSVDILFSENSTLSYEEKQIIAEALLIDSPDAQAYNLLCNLFGHKNTTENVTTLTHCARATAPRCLEEEWQVTSCSRCGNTETTRIAYGYKNCCS